jgi:hypothetical protein
MFILCFVQLLCFGRRQEQRSFYHLCSCPSKESCPFFAYPSFFILHSPGLDFTSIFFIRNGLDFTGKLFKRNGLDLTSTFSFETGKKSKAARVARRWAAF